MLSTFARALTLAWSSPASKWFLLLAIAFLLSLDAWGLSIWPGIFNPAIAGTWGDFVIATITLAAVVTALYESAAQRRAARLESLCAIGAWMEAVRTTSGDPRWYLHVENGTKFPIYRWVVIPTEGEPGLWHLCSVLHGPLVPGHSMFEIEAFQGADQANAIGAEITFVDREGTTRTRRANGILVDGLDEELSTHLEECRDSDEASGQ